MSYSSGIGLGIVGLGMGSGMFVAHGLPGSAMRVRAVCDVNPERLDWAVSTHHVAATTDYTELVSRSDVDVVGVYSPDPLHCQHVLAALDAGKHVICTKPLVSSLDEAVKVLEAVRDTGRKLLVGQTCRFVPAYATAKALADDGRFGTMRYVEAVYNHDLRDTYDRSAWRYQMPQDYGFGGLCHPMDLAFWVGGRIAQVSAFSATSELDPRYPSDVPQNFVANLRFASGALGRVMGLYAVPHIHGLPYINLWVIGDSGGSWENVVTWSEHCGDHRAEDIATHGVQPHEGTTYDGHHGEMARYLAHFEDCLRYDHEPSPGVLEGVRVIAALEAVRESASTGKATDVRWEF